MWKAIVVGTAALAIAGTSLVYAQQRGGRDGMMGDRDGMMQGRQFNAEDLRAFGEARIAALKAGLMLTPEQEKNWPAFEQAARDLAKVRMERRSAIRNAPATDDPVERLRQRATALSETGAALKKLADATDPLYKSLDENQKRRFAILNRLAGPDRGGFRGREGRDGGWFRGHDGDGMHHWGPRRFDRGMLDMEHPGGQRL
jgi:zinc resistance-associated protein